MAAYIRRHVRVEQTQFTWYLAGDEAAGTQIHMRALGGRSFAAGADTVHYEAIFEPPFSLENAQNSYVWARYVGPEGSAGRGACLQLVPSEGGEKSAVGSHRYVAFEAHALRLSGDKKPSGRLPKQAKRRRPPQQIDLAYLALENNQLLYSDPAVQLEPLAELGGWLHSRYGDRYVPLGYFPPDADILNDVEIRASGGIDTRLVPQRTPLWFKLRAEVSGTGAYKLLGFWVPSKQADPAWSWDAAPSFEPSQLVTMRFGRLREAYAAIAYLEHFPERRFRETGTVPYPGRPRWGASPDGIIDDPARPEGVVAEFKASRRDCSARAYYWPQMYMEMGATESQHADLVRYAELRYRDKGRWLSRHACRLFEVKRDADTEGRLLQCLVRAYENRARLQDVVQEEAFVALRDHFEQQARETPYISLEGEQTNKAIDAYREARAQFIRGPQLPSEVGPWAAIEERHARLFALDQEGESAGKEYLREIVQQVAAYASTIHE